MPEAPPKVYAFRWVVLGSFMLVVIMNQAAWITFAPITTAAAAYWHTTNTMVGLLSLVFMAVYVLLVIPIAWAIDTWGLRIGVGVGAILTALCAVTRGAFAESYGLVMLSQIGIAIGQPFILGSITKVAAHWFAPQERATAAGLGTLAVYLGILGAMGLTPMLLTRHGMSGMLYGYGVCSLAAAALFLIFGRERPATPPGPAGDEERALMFDGLRQMVRQRDYILLMAIFFIGLGIFNGVSTWIETIVQPRGFSIDQAGMLGALMLVGGLLGALVIPIISDRVRRRRPFVILSLCGMLPALLGMTFAHSYGLLLASGFAFGFFLLSSGPIGFQYGAEVARPAPEGTSNSLLIVMGQVSGVAFIFGMDAFKAPRTGDMTVSLLVLAALVVVSIILAFRLRESPIARR